MAVLVRSGKRSVPTIRRALVAAGVPIVVASDEIPVARDPAVGPLLLALRCADDPSALDEDAARVLLTSSLGRMSPADLRRLGRALRDLDRQQRAEQSTTGLVLPAPSAQLLREALASPADLLLVDERHQSVVRPVQQVAGLLAKARTVLTGGGSAEEALWEIWNGTGWPLCVMYPSGRAPESPSPMMCPASPRFPNHASIALPEARSTRERVT